MSLKNTTKVETNLYELEILIDKSSFDAAVERVYRKQVKNINVPGFRKGKAPRSIIEKMYGKGVFYEDAINECIPSVYPDALAESGLDVVGAPEFDVSSIDENGVVLKAKVYTKPEAKIADYIGIEVTKDVKAVTEDDVNNEISAVRERNARNIDITDRAAVLGDTVTIDFDGYVDGERFDGGKAEGHELKLGSGQFIPGFEDQIVGKSIGEEFDVNVTFPTEYHADNLAGKASVFKCKLHAIKETQLPELDDEFAKDVSEFDTFAEYKDNVKATIAQRYEKQAEAEADDQIMNTLIEKLEADIPAPMIDAEVENDLRDYDNRLRMQGLDLSTYFKYTGMNLDSLREQFRPNAERKVKMRLALEKIAELENITVSDEEVEKEFENIAKAYGMELEQVKSAVSAEDLAKDVKVQKAVDLVKEKAVVKAAKKTAAKKTSTKKAADTEVAEEKPAAKKTSTAKKTTTTKKADTEGAEKKPAAKKTTAKKTTTKAE